MALNLEDYALIGDCQTAALVGRDGSIDWLCWPRFDSSACFAALLGTRDNGRWLLGAVDPAARVSRRYRDATLVLETEIETADGAADVIDFMPPRGKNSDLVRLVCGKRGRLAMRTELIVRFDYGSLVPWVTNPEGGAWRAICGPDMVVLRTPVAARQRSDHSRRIHGGGGRDHRVRSHLWPVPSDAARIDRRRRSLARDGNVLARLGKLGEAIWTMV
jgi:GH15 family glucan-1,4-alpha-glucosidase